MLSATGSHAAPLPAVSSAPQHHIGFHGERLFLSFACMFQKHSYLYAETPQELSVITTWRPSGRSQVGLPFAVFTASYSSLNMAGVLCSCPQQWAVCIPHVWFREFCITGELQVPGALRKSETWSVLPCCQSEALKRCGTHSWQHTACSTPSSVNLYLGGTGVLLAWERLAC